jgi:hypothetical protein
MENDDIIPEGTFASNDALSKKYDLAKWVGSEKRLSKSDLAIIDAIYNYVNRISSTTSSDNKVMGNVLYLLCRPSMVSQPVFKLVDELGTEVVAELEETSSSVKKKKKKPKHKQPVINKKDEIRLNSSKKKAQDVIDGVFTTFNETIFRPQNAFNSDIVEVKCIGFMYASWFLLRNRAKYRKMKFLPFVLGIIVAVQRFLNVCEHDMVDPDKTYKGRSMCVGESREPTSIQALEDLQVWLDRLKANFHFNGFIVCDYAPELMIVTDYDIGIPKKEIKPREHQKEILDFAENHMESGFVAIYDPMVGLGKTTVGAVGLGKLVEKLRHSSPKYKYLQLLLVCNLDSVKDYMAQLCYNGNIKFGIGSIGADRSGATYKITNHNICKNDDERIAIICSAKVAYEIFLDSSQDDIKGPARTRYLMFLDEPNAGADNPDSQSLYDNVAVMAMQPKWSIWSSATFPSFDDISPIISMLTLKYRGIYVGTVHSGQIQIGCDVNTFEGDQVVPHLGVITGEQLTRVIASINGCPFLGRLYTTQVARALWRRMTNVGIANVPNISEIFSNIDNMSADKVRLISMEMLSLLATQDNALVASVCSSVITDVEHVDVDADEGEHVVAAAIDDNDGIEWAVPNVVEPDGEHADVIIEDVPTNPVDPTKLGTVQAYRHLNMSIFADNDPVNFALTNFASLIADIKESVIDSAINVKFKTLDNVLMRYARDLDAHQKIIASLERNIENEDNREQQIQALPEPTVKFPSFGHVNSEAHIDKYAPSHKSKTIKRFWRSPISLETIPYTKMSVPNDLVILLMAGVGVNSLSITDEAYNATVSDLMTDGRLAYIISDDSICFGANHPVVRVFITDTFALTHSLNTLFQLMGRAGRVGRSWKAQVYVSRPLAQRIINFVMSTEQESTEAVNMVNMFRRISLKLRDIMQKRVSEIQNATKVKDVVKKSCGLSVIPPKNTAQLRLDNFASSLGEGEASTPLSLSSASSSTMAPKDVVEDVVEVIVEEHDEDDVSDEQFEKYMTLRKTSDKKHVQKSHEVTAVVAPVKIVKISEIIKSDASVNVSSEEWREVSNTKVKQGSWRTKGTAKEAVAAPPVEDRPVSSEYVSRHLQSRLDERRVQHERQDKRNVQPRRQDNSHRDVASSTQPPQRISKDSAPAKMSWRKV